MRKKENQTPLNSQLNLTMGNLYASAERFKNGGELLPMVIQMMAVKGGVDKTNDVLLPDYVMAETRALLKALIDSGLYDQTHCACFVVIQSDLKFYTLMVLAKAYDILHKNYPEM